MTETALLIMLGLVGGFSAGLLGLGGALVLAPLLLAAPPLLGMDGFSMRQVAAITLVYLLCSAGAATLLGRRRSAAGADGGRTAPVRGLAGLGLGLVGAMAALGGGLLSVRLTNRTLLLLTALFATMSSLLLAVPIGHRVGQRAGAGSARWVAWLAALAAAGTGALTGLVGAAGGFLLKPVILRLGLPARSASTTALRIVQLSTLGGLLGKGLTGQVDLGVAAPLVGGALPTAWWGGELSQRINPRRLRWAALLGAWMATGTLWVMTVPALVERVRPGHLYLLAAVVAAAVPFWWLARQRWGLTVAGPQLRPLDAGEPPEARLPEPMLPEELKRSVLEGPMPQIIDVREPQDAARGWIPGSVNIPADQFAAWLEAADPGDGAVIVCRTGFISAQVCALAARRGHRTRYLEGGMAAWEGPLVGPGRAEPGREQPEGEVGTKAYGTNVSGAEEPPEIQWS